MHLSDAYIVFEAFHHFIQSLSVLILLNEALGSEHVLWLILLQSGGIGFISDFCLLGCSCFDSRTIVTLDIFRALLSPRTD